MKKSIVFALNKTNKNSIKALCGAFEKSGIVPEAIFAKSPEDIKDLRGKALIIFSFTTPDILLNRKAISKWMEYAEKSIKVAGGPHPSGDPIKTLDMGFDYVFIGEGEESFPEAVKRFMKGEDFDGVPGFFRKGLKVSKGKKVDLDDFPPVSFHYSRLGAIEIMRGCPHGCKFCQTSYLFGKNVRERSVENTLYWVKKIFQKGIKDIRFIAPDAFSYGGTSNAMERLLEGARNILKENGKLFFGTFPSEVRPESVTREKINLVKRFCDNKRIGIGAQSGSRRILDISRRGHTPDDVVNAVEIIRGEGLDVYVDFIFGLPYETEKDEEETIRLIKELVRLGAKIHGHTFMPLSGTPYAKKRPGKLSERIKKLMGDLTSKGMAFGKWSYQERIFSGY